MFGKPIVNKNRSSGTESGRVWKIDTVHEEKRAELTIHFYNKPIKSKKSKFLIQGGTHAFKSLFVFDEMPKIYRMVCKSKSKVPIENTDCFATPINYQKRRRLSTSIKKRNIRHKPAQKPHEILCGFCDFTSVSNVKMIRHMKSTHTQPNLMDITPKVLAEDLSLCGINDVEPLVVDEAENWLSENELCEHCDYAAENRNDMEKHCDDHHTQPSATLDEITQKPTPVVKPLPLYKCNECSFATITTEELLVHKKDIHKKSKATESETYLHSCISCAFKTNEFNNLTLHVDSNHRPLHVRKCNLCNYESVSVEELNKHVSALHTDEVLFQCTSCDFHASSNDILKYHIDTEHIQGVTFTAKVEEPPKDKPQPKVVNGKSIACPFCDLESKNPDELKTHIANIHIKPTKDALSK